MVMHCGVKRKINCLTDTQAPPTPDRTHYHHQALLDISIHKLQEEQAKHGIEPRLLRFVLINNAIKVLQAHMMATSQHDDQDDGFSVFKSSSSSDVFLSNTLSHGSLLSYPPSPPTPAKLAKFDNDHVVNDSPLSLNNTTASCSFQNLGCSEVDGGNMYAPLVSDEFRLRSNGVSSSPSSPTNGSSSNCCSSSSSPISSICPLSNEIDDVANECKKKRPRPLSISIDDQLPSLQPGTYDDCGSTSLASPTTPTSEQHSNSLSPIDFAKVDVSLYDFDARTNLIFPPVLDAIPHHTSAPSGLSSSLQAQSFASSPKLEHLYELQPDEEEEEEEEEEEDLLLNDNEDPDMIHDSDMIHNDDVDHVTECQDGVDPTDTGDRGACPEGDPPTSSSTSITASSSSSSSVGSLSPDGFDSFDDPHEIDRIVSLLMA